MDISDLRRTVKKSTYEDYAHFTGTQLSSIIRLRYEKMFPHFILRVLPEILWRSKSKGRDGVGEERRRLS
jgi:hypothetical protein